MFAWTGLVWVSIKTPITIVKYPRRTSTRRPRAVIVLIVSFLGMAVGIFFSPSRPGSCCFRGGGCAAPSTASCVLMSDMFILTALFAYTRAAGGSAALASAI